MFIKLLIFYRLHEFPLGSMHTFSFSSRAIYEWVCGRNCSVLMIASAVLESHLLADYKGRFVLFSSGKCFPFSVRLHGIARKSFVVSLAFQRNPHHPLVIHCLGRMLLSARRCVQCFTCGIFQLHSLLRALGHLEKEKLSGCACVRAVAAAQKKGLQWRCWVWLSRSEYIQGWFVPPVPALGRRPWRLPGVLKPAWL